MRASFVYMYVQYMHIILICRKICALVARFQRGERSHTWHCAKLERRVNSVERRHAKSDRSTRLGDGWMETGELLKLSSCARRWRKCWGIFPWRICWQRATTTSVEGVMNKYCLFICVRRERRVHITTDINMYTYIPNIISSAAAAAMLLCWDTIAWRTHLLHNIFRITFTRVNMLKHYLSIYEINTGFECKHNQIIIVQMPSRLRQMLSLDEDDVCMICYCLLFTDMPILTLKMGATLNPNNIKEGDSVYFECFYEANPKPYKLNWYHNVSEMISS